LVVIVYGIELLQFELLLLELSLDEDELPFLQSFHSQYIHSSILKHGSFQFTKELSQYVPILGEIRISTSDALHSQ
jgi:hypothetical protein